MKKFIFFIVCGLACITMYAMSDWCNSEEYIDPDSGIIPLGYSLLAILLLVISQAVNNPWGMVTLLFGSVFFAALNGTDTLLTYLVCLVCIAPIVRFTPEIRNMIRCLWAPEKKQEQ